MKKFFCFSILLCLSLLCNPIIQAENWPNWRGPNYNGSTDANNLPVNWSKTDNIAWKTPLPGASAATPIIWNDHVFVSSINENTQQLLAICINRKNGDVLWQKNIGIGYGEQRRHNKASPSPVTDGEHVYFYYGTGDLACFDFEGNQIWERQLEEDHGSFSVQWGYGSSPLLYKGKLYIPVLQRDTILQETDEPRNSFLLAIDPKTGKDLWKHIRPSDANRESHESYVTPIPYEHNGRSAIIIHGGDYTTAHDPKNGEEIWRWGSYNPRKIGHWRIVPSPVTGKGHVFVSAPKRAPLYAIDGTENGKLALDEAEWKFEKNPTDVCTPAFYQGYLYVYDGDRYVMTCMKPETGEVIWSGELGGNKVYRSSPTIGDDKIYCMNEDGLIVVLDAKGDEYKELSRIEMGEGPCRSAIAIADDQLFIRTAENLYCVEKNEN